MITLITLHNLEIHLWGVVRHSVLLFYSLIENYFRKHSVITEKTQ